MFAHHPLSASGSRSLFNGILEVATSSPKTPNSPVNGKTDDEEDGDEDGDDGEDNMVAHDLTMKKCNSSNPTPKLNSKVEHSSLLSSIHNNNNNHHHPLQQQHLFKKTSFLEDAAPRSTTSTLSTTTRKVPSNKGKKGSSEKTSSGHSKRGVLPKQATSIMRSWLFQHIVVSEVIVQF